jgi:hypothetical protein
MISKQEWWSIVEAYGTQIWPAQVILYVGAVLVVVWLLIKHGRIQNLFTKIYLSIAFAWNAIAFFMILAKGITGNTYGNYFFGSIFLLVSVLFMVNVFGQKMQFRLPEAGWRKYATIALSILVLCYPILSMALGHNLRGSIIPGSFPCPTTALGLIMLTTALPQANKIAYILLLLWAIPFPPLIQIPKYGVYEDTIMFVCGVFSLILLVRYWKARNQSNQVKSK